MSRSVLWRAACLVLEFCVWNVDGSVARTTKLTEGEVVRGVKPFVQAFQEQLAHGDTSSCQSTYVESASLHASLGPFAAALKSREGMLDPTVVRGAEDITKFWVNTIKLFGPLVSLNDDGENAFKGDASFVPFVVDDDTVIVTGAFKFDTPAEGRVSAQTWIRQDNAWRIKTDMYHFEKGEPNGLLTPGGLRPTTTPKPWSALLPSMPHLQKPNVSALIPGLPTKNHTLVVVEDVAETGGSLVMYVCMFLSVAFVVFYVVRAQRRSARLPTIGGPDSLLG